ncbi:MAG TPA: hypothetical protein VFM46_10255 [Pseudomonadales bacterium]|nr:hypothetical protein [Pseudomonadales bacterium]
MSLYDVQPGDVVYAAHAIHNDGSIPGVAEDLLLAERGTRVERLNANALA